jgi:hypothetical protein
MAARRTLVVAERLTVGLAGKPAIRRGLDNPECS